MIPELSTIQVNAVYACAAFVGTAVVAFGLTRGVKFLSGGAKKSLAAASLVGMVLIGSMTVTSVRIAAAKTNDTQQVGGDLSSTNDVGQIEGGTNGMSQVGGPRSVAAGSQMENVKLKMENECGVTNILHSPFYILHSNAALPENAVTDEDIARRWYVASVSSNSLDTSIFAFPSAVIEQSPTVWEAAQRRGAVYGAWNIPLKGWNFPFDDHGWSNAFMRCEGILRDSFRDASDQIRFLSPFALCPAANWARYNLSASRAWCATNGLGGLTVAVENGALGNDSTKLASARIDLDPLLGEIRLRYDLSHIGDTTFDIGPTVNGTNTFVMVGSNTSEVVFRRVHPNDWDYDGLANSLDPNPRVPENGAGWNQSDIWGSLAYPSNATEISSLGYPAWVTGRAADPNRRLVSFTVNSQHGNWPIRLTVGDLPVLCDGKEKLKFAIDCGAKYAFSLSEGQIPEIAVLTTNGVEHVYGDPYFGYPVERSIWDVTIHWDSPQSGWVGCKASVGIKLDGRDVCDFGHGDSDGGIFGHFLPGALHVLTGEVHQCHSNAFLGCTWSGGPGFSFSNPHRLSTDVMWIAPDDTSWATNFISLVTWYKGGYSLTNIIMACVGPEHVPPLGFSLSCQDVLFLNDELRPERIYAVTVGLTATNGVEGQVTLECDGAESTLSYFHDVFLPTQVQGITFPLGVSSNDWFHSSKTVFMSCSAIGDGELRASISFTNGTSCATSKVFRVIEPIRKLVDNERYSPGHYYNPSRLVYGDVAHLRVGVNGTFNPGDVDWRIVSGPGRRVTYSGFLATIEATAEEGTVVVEARFNEDEIQPTFVLPIVKPRVIPVRAFVAPPPRRRKINVWKARDIRARIDMANDIFSQVGISFNLLSTEYNFCSETNWNIRAITTQRDENGEYYNATTDQLDALLDHYQGNDCIELYFLGEFRDKTTLGIHHEKGLVISRRADVNALAHELGHQFGLKDCYSFVEHEDSGTNAWTLLPDYYTPVKKASLVGKNDWGEETGRGFYEFGDKHGVVYGSFLMFGYNGLSPKDIPDGQVFSLKEHATSSNETWYVEIGAEGINTNNVEVYTQ